MTPAEDVIAFLRDVPLLDGCGPPVLAELAGALERVSVPAGAYLFREGEPADSMAIVYVGRLEVWFEQASVPVLGGVAGPGAALGELALLTRSTRSASVRAARDSELLIISRDVFGALFAREPALSSAIARNLGRRLQSSADLVPPRAPTSVIALIPLMPDVPVHTIAEALSSALAAPGEVACLMGRPDSLPEDAEPAFARLLDRCDAESAFTLIVGPEAERDPAWLRFCMRSADRVVLLSGGGRPPAWALRDKSFDQRDVAFVDGPLSAAAMREHLDRLNPRAHHHLGNGASFSTDIARMARRLTDRALGLVLSGGGARGLAHVGVIERLVDAGVDIDLVGGCSMGAFVGAMVGRGWPTSTILSTCQTELVQRRPFNDYTFPRVSLIRARKARSMMTRTFGEAALEELALPTFTVSADLDTGELVVHTRGSVFSAVGASMSIPGLVPPVAHDGRLLVDGGLLDNLPVDVMRERSDGPIIAVNVMRRPATDALGNRVVYRRVTEVPSIVETMSRATFLGSQQRAASNREIADVVIEPAVADIGLLEFDRMNQAVAAGRRAADRALDDGLLEAIKTAALR